MTTRNGIVARPRVLFVSNLYPNPRESARGIFNQQTVHALAGELDIRVLAPVPWFPGKNSMAGIPPRLDDHGVTVQYVRAFYTPGVLRNLHGDFFRRSIRATVTDIRRDFPFDVLYGSWIYPDGYGVATLAEEFGVPCVLHALGSDIHQYLGHPRRRKIVLDALARAAHVICVSRYIRDRIVQAGIPAGRTSVIYDGVDTSLFAPRDRREARARLGLPLEGRIILFVGSLRPVKGPEHLIDAFAKLRSAGGRDVHLAMVGAGSLRAALEARAQALGIGGHVTFAGPREHREVPEWMSAADVLCLSSLDEGMPNVVLEALASGRPVVATHVGGVDEAIDGDQLGILVRPGDAEALAAGLQSALSREWDENALAAKAGQFSWQDHAAQIGSLLKTVAAGRRV